MIQIRMKAYPWNNIGVLVRDAGATPDWSAVDGVLTKICGPRPDDGNWTKFFNKFDFDWDTHTHTHTDENTHTIARTCM